MYEMPNCWSQTVRGCCYIVFTRHRMCFLWSPLFKSPPPSRYLHDHFRLWSSVLYPRIFYGITCKLRETGDTHTDCILSHTWMTMEVNEAIVFLIGGTWLLRWRKVKEKLWLLFQENTQIVLTSQQHVQNIRENRSDFHRHFFKQLGPAGFSS